MHLFAFGLGYSALRLIEILTAEKSEIKISGTKRAFPTPPLDENVNIINIDELAILPKDITHILISIPPHEMGDLVYERYLKQIEKLPNLEWLAYFSTTGVYGDYKGGWVNEASQCKTTNPRSLNRLKAENQWLKAHLNSKIPSHIFRLSGIYGPFRSEFDKIIAGKAQAIFKKDQVFSRIHVDDIANALVHSIRKPSPGEIFNLADDYPCPTLEILEFTSKLLHKPLLKQINFEDAELSEMAKSFYKENKRVDNKKIKEKLGLKLKFPTYREGYTSLFNDLYFNFSS